MTMQMRDTYRYKGKTYYPLEIKGKLEFNPFKYNLHPTAQCSACWAGYFCEYEIVENALYLDKLYIHHEDDIYPELNGVSINRNIDDDCMEHYHYDNLHLPITGRGTCRMLLGSDCVASSIKEINDFRNYKTLKEFVFKKGVLKEVKKP